MLLRDALRTQSHPHTFIATQSPKHYIPWSVAPALPQRRVPAGSWPVSGGRRRCALVPVGRGASQATASPGLGRRRKGCIQGGRGGPARSFSLTCETGPTPATAAPLSSAACLRAPKSTHTLKSAVPGSSSTYTVTQGGRGGEAGRSRVTVSGAPATVEKRSGKEQQVGRERSASP